jgi:hypothetical protein
MSIFAAASKLPSGITLKEGIGKAKEFLETEAGFLRYSLELHEVAESQSSSPAWDIIFYYRYPQQETYCVVTVSKSDGEILAFKKQPVKKQ